LCDVPTPGHNGIERKGTARARRDGDETEDCLNRRTLGRLESASARATGACIDHLVVAGEAHLRRISTGLAAAVLTSIYGELIRRAFVIGKRFFIAGIRLPRVASQTARHCINSRLVLTKREVALFLRRCSRAIYTPFLSAAGLES
jgi:hypothetical protein